MCLIRRPFTPILVAIIASLVGYCAFQHYTYLPRRLGLSILPWSVEIESTYVASWTDYYHEWIISVAPNDSSKLVSGRKFVRMDSGHLKAVFLSETGAHSAREIRNVNQTVRANATAQKPLFKVGEEFCEGDWRFDGQICIYFSEDRDRALIQYSAD